MRKQKPGAPTILLVEDETLLRALVGKKLTHEGYKVYEAENGKVGLEHALKYHPDLILLDIVMPLMDGVSMLNELRKDPWGKDANAVFLTNLSNVEGLLYAEAHDVANYMVKADWSLEDLVKEVRKRL